MVVPVTWGPIESAIRPPQRTSLPASVVSLAPARTAIPVTAPQTMLRATTVPWPPSTRIPVRPFASASLSSTWVPTEVAAPPPEGEAPLSSGRPLMRMPFPRFRSARSPFSRSPVDPRLITKPLPPLRAEALPLTVELSALRWSRRPSSSLPSNRSSWNWTWFALETKAP